MSIPKIQCDCCGGTGKRELSADHWRTLQLIQRFEPPVIRPLLDEKGITPNAINNRLLFLENAGLIERSGKDGKFILWRSKNHNLAGKTTEGGENA